MGVEGAVLNGKLKSLYDSAYSIVMVWTEANASAMGAAVAFYTIFAIAPLFILVLALAGVVFGHQAAQGQLFEEIQKLIGRNGSQSVQSLLMAARQPKATLLATIVGFSTLFIGANSVFIQLQQALNAIWNVRVKLSGVRRFFKYRFLSFLALLGIGFILLVSLIISAGLDAVGKWMSGIVPAHIFIWKTIDFATSLGIITLLFAMIFKMLPDVRIAWRDVWVGSLITALLFTVGKFLLGAYLGRSSLSSAYGALGSFVVVLLWVYYSAQILLLGAAFVRVYADRYGSHSRPGADAEFANNHH
ncbi:MAG TPA: YihY/virulence factor BrkB family protein [Candidatus Sulfotelmatobacter sp.]|nr:YihY/virulence factor BrkB family protein [Candidatus Sulfotelmatobacter sp.]